jgi:hypothetical protein
MHRSWHSHNIKTLLVASSSAAVAARDKAQSLKRSSSLERLLSAAPETPPKQISEQDACLIIFWSPASWCEMEIAYLVN